MPVEIGLEEFRAARARIQPLAYRTPTLPASLETPGAEIFLKLENLQPVGSFKVRGAANAIASFDASELADGVSTVSAGNMALALAWVAKRAGLPCAVLVPENAPRAKTDAIERVGGELLRVPFDTWWNVMEGGRSPHLRGAFIHPVADRQVVAGNGTIGLEILEDLPDVDTVLVPFGGGGLAAGIAMALASSGSSARVIPCEVASAAPLAAALAAGAPVPTDYQPSFVDGIGGRCVLPAMWPLISARFTESIVTQLDEVEGALAHLALRCHVVAEGAGAVPLAAALSGRAGGGKIVCVISGGNIDGEVLASILSGRGR